MGDLPRTRKQALEALINHTDYCGHDVFDTQSLPTLDMYPPIHGELLTCQTCGKEYAISWQASYDDLHTINLKPLKKGGRNG